MKPVATAVLNMLVGIASWRNRGTVSVPIFGMVILASGMVQAAQIARPDTIQRFSGETDEQFNLRKQRITYGTPENRRYCRDDLSIYVGLWKGGEQWASIYVDMYKAWCVAPGANADDAVANVPVRSHEVYFNYRDGHWQTRAEYCAWRAKTPVYQRNLAEAQRNFDKDCTGL